MVVRVSVGVNGRKWDLRGDVDHLVPSTARSVFWDLYCAAPDRREACEHTSEAKVFQDYVSLQDSGIWATSFVFVYFFILLLFPR